MVYRDLVTRAVATACKIAASDSGVSSEASDRLLHEMVSAVGEAFNNVVLHAYAGVAVGQVALDIDTAAGQMCIELRDDGASFDIDAVPEPELEQLPEGGMGLFIIRSFVDDMSYEPGKPNVLRMRKKLSGEAS